MSDDNVVTETPIVTPADETTTLPQADDASSEIDAISKADEQIQEATPETTAEEQEEQHQKKSGFEKRVSKLNAKISNAEREAEYWKQEALRHNQQPVAVPTPQVPQEKPTFAQYNDIEKYTDAMTEWKLAQRDIQVAQQRAQEQQMTTLQTYNKRAADFATANPDFHDVLADADDVQCAPEIHQSCLDSEVGPAIAYYLALNQDEITRINALPPHRRLIELGKLEDKLTTKKDSNTGKTVVVKATKAAPAPVKAVTGSATTATKSIYEMTPQELIAHRNAASRNRR